MRCAPCDSLYHRFSSILFSRSIPIMDKFVVRVINPKRTVQSTLNFGDRENNSKKGRLEDESNPEPELSITGSSSPSSSSSISSTAAPADCVVDLKHYGIDLDGDVDILVVDVSSDNVLLPESEPSPSSSSTVSTPSSRPHSQPPKSKRSKPHYSAHARHSQYPDFTHVSGNKLFCTPCNTVLDHTRNSSVQKHFNSDKHDANVKKQEGESASKATQRTITEATADGPCTIPGIERNALCKDVVSAFTAANIPLSKLDHPALRTFFHKHVTNGGAVPKSKQLKDTYLQRSLADHKDVVMDKVKNKPLAIICDEMSDDIGRFVLNILAAPMEQHGDYVKSYLLETVFLPSTNHSTVATAVIQCLVKWGIEFNNVYTFNTDNAAYMRKAFNDILKGLLTNCVHVTCMSHIMNLLGEAFKKPFALTNKYVKATNAIFWNAGARKARFIRHLKSVEPSNHPKMPPNPIGTRWNCWFDAVTYHHAHVDHMDSFVASEMEHSGNTAPESLRLLAALFADKEEVLMLQAEMAFIKDKSAAFVLATDAFQSQKPLAVKAWSKLEDLQHSFGSGGVTRAQAEQYISEELPTEKSVALQDLFCQAYAAVEDKLEKYMSPAGQPGIDFIRQVQFFDPSKLVLFDEPHLQALPALQSVPEDQLRRYKEILGPRSIKASGGIPLDLCLFWNSCSVEVPELSKVARAYICACLSSADAERSFSLYNLVFSERRRSLSEDNLQSLVFLYYNNFIMNEVFSE